MAAFQFFVHRTFGIVKEVNSIPCNLPEGGFYSLQKAVMFAELIADRDNVTAIYDVNGKLHTVVPRAARRPGNGELQNG